MLEEAQRKLMNLLNSTEGKIDKQVGSYLTEGALSLTAEEAAEDLSQTSSASSGSMVHAAVVKFGVFW